MSGVKHNARRYVPNVIRNAMPEEWRNGLCPECERFARWTVMSDMFSPAHGYLECCFCDNEAYFEVDASDE